MRPCAAAVPGRSGTAIVALPSWSELVRLVLTAATDGSGGLSVRGHPGASAAGPADGSARAEADAAAIAGAGAGDTGGPVPSFDAAVPADHAETWALVSAAQQGDGDAFGQLYDRYVDTVYRFVYYRVHDRALAEDFTSETFLRALRRISEVTYQGRDIGAWFVTIARNIVFDHAKSARSRLEITTGELMDGADRGSGPEATVLTALTNEVLLRAVDRLGDEQRECVVLRFLNGLSVAETAEVMRKNDGAIKALQHRAVKRLAALVGAELAPD